jgi:capsular exopolysaccharide synthesis family protein
MRMEFKEYASALKKWAWLIALAAVLAGGISYWSSSRMAPIYQASAVVRVGQYLQSANPGGGDFATSQQLAQSYAQMVRRQSILQATIDTLGWNARWEVLAGQVNAIAVPNSPLIRIIVIDSNPQRAKVIADEIARQLILQSPTPSEQQEEQERAFVNQQIASLQEKIQSGEAEITELEAKMDLEVSATGLQATQGQIALVQQKINNWQGNYVRLLDLRRGSRTNHLSIDEPAFIPSAPINTNNALSNVLLAASIGFLLAAAGAILLEHSDDRIKTPDDVDTVLKLPCLGTISSLETTKDPSSILVSGLSPTSPISEMYRVLRTRLEFLGLRNSPAVMLVTSPGPGDGKTTTACNLAITIARDGRRVILVDADLRQPSIHRVFGVPNPDGLSTLLLDENRSLESALLQHPSTGLRFLRSGPLPPNPGELLNSEMLRRRLAQMREIADVVVIDSPAVLAGADATILGAQCTGAIMIVNAQQTRRNAAQQAKAIFDQVGLKFQGVVLNAYSASTVSYHHYASAATSLITTDAIPRFGQDASLPLTPCPYLGLNADPSSIIMGPSPQHRCYATGKSQKIDDNHQARYCLVSTFGTCPRFVPRPDRVPVAASIGETANGAATTNHSRGRSVDSSS